MQVKKRLMITNAVLGALVLACGGLGVWSVVSIGKISAQIFAEQKAINDRYALRRYVSSSVTNLSDTKTKIGALGAADLKEGRELEFVTALESAAAASGVDEQIDLQTANQKDVAPWEKMMPLRLTIVGTYPQVLAQVNAIERLPYYVAIGGIAVTGSPSSPDAAVKVTATVDATVYWLSAKAPDFVRGEGGGAGDAMNP